MAHDLYYDEVARRHSIFVVREPAWHKLGIVLDNAVNWQEAMKQALLGWEVEKSQLARYLPDTKHDDRAIQPIDAYGIFRKDTGALLGTVGKDYKIIQNQYAFEFVDTLLEAENGAHYVTAGALGKGERIWCLAQIGGSIQIAGTDDESIPYLLFQTSHDGSMSAICKITWVRVVCANTLSVALQGAGTYLKIKHTSHAEDRMEAAKKLMTGATVQMKHIEDKLNELAHRRVNRQIITEVMKNVFGEYDKEHENNRLEKKMSTIYDLFESNDENKIPEIRGTAYNLLNAFTEYVDHHAAFRRTEGRKGMEDEAIRAENALFGHGDSLKGLALAAIFDATENAQRHDIQKGMVTLSDTDLERLPNNES